MADSLIPGFEASDALLVFVAPFVRKMVQSIVEKYPKLYGYAIPIGIVIGTVVMALVDLVPMLLEMIGIPRVMLEAWIKGGIVISGAASVYNDWRAAKKAATIESKAIAQEASPQVVAEEKAKEAGEPAPTTTTPDFNSDI